MAQIAQSILTVHQKKILDAISQEKYFTDRYYLAGGTALSEFYLKHRLSEDLDFFCEQEEVKPVYINKFFETKKKDFNLVKIETSQYFGLFNFFLHFQDSEVLKIDFNYYPFTKIEKGVFYNNLEIEDIYDIGVDKVHTIALKPRARDLIDIYFIIKEKDYNFLDLLKQAKAKFDWDITSIELGARFLQASKLTDFPRMLKEIDHKQWQQFFLNEAKKLKKDIFE